MDIFHPLSGTQTSERGEASGEGRVIQMWETPQGISVWTWCEALPPVPVRVVLFASVYFFIYWFFFLSIYTHRDYCTKMVTFTGCFSCVKTHAFVASFVHHCNHFKMISFVPELCMSREVCIHLRLFTLLGSNPLGKIIQQNLPYRISRKITFVSFVISQ